MPDVMSAVAQSRPNWACSVTSAFTPTATLIASHREPMVAMLRRQPILDRLFVQEAGYVVDLASRTVTLDLPTASGRLLSFENYISVYHRARLRR
jgi:hypothetical protein